MALKYKKDNDTRHNIALLDLGKLPPQAVDLEVSLLGAILIDPQCLEQIYNELNPLMFYKDVHQKIYSTIVILYDSNAPIDILTVTEQLRRDDLLDEVGGPLYITQLTSNVANSANVPFWTKIIKDKYFMREMINITVNVQNSCFDEKNDTADIIELWQSTFEKTVQDYLGMQRKKTLKEFLNQSLKEYDIREALAKENKLAGIPMPIAEMTLMMNGWQNGDLTIVAGRPGSGKTSALLAFLKTCAKHLYKAAVFSLEMPGVRLVDRLLCGEAEINPQKFKKGLLNEYEKQKLQKAKNDLYELGIDIDDNANVTMDYIKNMCRILKSKGLLDILFIDYLQLILSKRERNKNREQEVSDISRGAKLLAKELDIPVIILAQLNRDVERRGGTKRPQLSDLRESGCLTGDSLVHLSSGELIPIKDLVGMQPEVFSFDGQKMVKAQARKVWSTGIKKVYQITTASKRIIKATANHPFLKLKGWSRLDELKVGDKIATPRILNKDCTEGWSDHKLIILGHLIGDGSFTKRQPLRYYSDSMDNLKALENSLTIFFGIKPKWVDCGTYTTLLLSSGGNKWHPNPLKVWLEDIGLYGHNFLTKHIPNEVFKMSLDKISLFLRHLWSTDGSILISKDIESAPKIYYSSSSKLLINQIRHLLLFYGIQSRISSTQKPGTNENFQINIFGKKNQLLFLEKIGTFGHQIEPGLKIINYHGDKISNQNVDTFPLEIYDYIKSVMTQKNISQRDMAKLRGTSYGGSSHFSYCPTAEVIESYSEILQDEYLEKVSKIEIFWDEINEIIELNEEEVFDMEVPGTHNFVANGFIVHNSLEQDSDNVILIYRAEYYKFDEYEDGTPSKGVGEFMIEKQRNGSTGVVRFGYDEALTRIFDYIDPNNIPVSVTGSIDDELLPPMDLSNSDKPF